MSRVDQQKWDERYRSGAFAERVQPSALLADWLQRLPRGRALDIACGAGRNSLFLARHGYEVAGVDISGEGLRRARAAAQREGLKIRWLQYDLDKGLPDLGEFDLICLFRYLNQDLIRALPKRLAPGGVVMVEEHLEMPPPDHGPSGGATRPSGVRLQAAAATAAPSDCAATDPPLVGPSNPAFRTQHGELRRLLPELVILHQEEGVIREPDRRRAAVARLVGRT